MIDVAAAIIYLNDRVLLARRKSGRSLAGYWEFPGGKIEAGESAQTCIEREIREELGVTASAGDLIASSIYVYDDLTIRLIAIEAKVDSHAFVLSDHDNVEWLQVKDLLSVQLAPADVPIAQHLIDSRRT